MFLWGPSTKIFQINPIHWKNMATRGRGLFSLYVHCKILKILSKSSCLILRLFGTYVPWVIFFQGYSNKSDPLKNMATRGVVCFPNMYRVKSLKTIEVLLNQVSDIGPSWPSCLLQQLEIWSECLSELYLGQVRIWVLLGQKHSNKVKYCSNSGGRIFTLSKLKICQNVVLMISSPSWNMGHNFAYYLVWTS